MTNRFICLLIIAYSAALLLTQDWPMMTMSVHTTSMIFLVKMVVDIGFGAIAAIRLFGDIIFMNSEVKATDMAVSDPTFYGFFLLNLFINACLHGYTTVETTGSSSFTASIYFIADIVVMVITFVLFRLAVAKAQRDAQIANGGNVSKIDRAA